MKKTMFVIFMTVLATVLFVLPLKLYAQSREVSGRVTEVGGNPLKGVSVMVQGKTLGTETDADGRFNIAADPKDSLVFSHIGFAVQQESAQEDMLQIIMESEAGMFEAVAVIGYGTVRKSDLTGSVATINTKDFRDVPASSVDRLLQGRAAGLQVVNASQEAGAGAEIRIRGGSSLRGSNAPLIVVDGFPLGDAGNLKQINPEDIASIEVLKDASSSAIYGSRGANGVIMITTKKGKKGKPSLSLKNLYTISQFSSKILQWRDPILMMQLSNEERINAGLAPLYTGNYSDAGVYYPSIEEVSSGAWPYFTDWPGITFQDWPTLNNSMINFSSATESTQLSLSANYFNQQGIFIKDSYRKGAVNLNLNHRFTEKLKLSAFVNLSKDHKNTNTGLASWRNPLWPVYDSLGNYFLNGSLDYDHPIALTNHVQNETKTTDLISSLKIDWELFKNVKWTSQLNYKYGASIQDRYYPKKYTANGTNNNGAGYINNWTGETLTTDNYITYDQALGNKHQLAVMGGTSFENYLARTSELQSFGFVNESLGNENMGAGDPAANRHFNGLTNTKLLSFMFRTNYTFDDKYLFTFTGRADGSSKFGANNRWAYFPSGAIAWKMHHEDFIQNLNIFDELKLRVSYGVSGNQGLSPYQTLSRFGMEQYYINGAWQTIMGPGYIIGRTGADNRYNLWGGIPNKDLKWETTAQSDIGLDMAFLSNRLKIAADYYHKKTYDLLREIYLPLSSGFDKMWTNDGDILNKGFEFTASMDWIKRKDVDFSSTLIFSKNKNQVLSLGNSVASGLITDYFGLQYEFIGDNVSTFGLTQTSPTILANNFPINAFYGYRVQGIVQNETEGLEAGLKGLEAKPGEFLYMDLNNDGVVDASDRMVIGDPNPDFMASLNLFTRYKQFDFSVFLNGVYGNDVLNPGKLSNLSLTPLRWTQDNPTNAFPSVRSGRSIYVSDWFIEDGSFLRIQNINLGYNVKKLAYFKNSRISLNAENLYTFTRSNFTGYDPEVPMRGVYSGIYPRYRRFTLSLELGF